MSSLKEQILFSVGAKPRGTSVVFILAALPAFTILSLIESKFSVILFLKGLLANFLEYTRAFWKLVFEHIQIGFDITVYQSDLLTLFSVSISAALAEILIYKSNVSDLANPPEGNGRLFGAFVRIVPLTLVVVLISLPNIVQKLRTLEGFTTITTLTFQALAVIVLLFLLSLIYKKIRPGTRFVASKVMMLYCLYVFFQISFVPENYSIRYHDELQGIRSEDVSLLYQYIATAMFTVMFLLLYRLAWRVFLRAFLLIGALLISDWLVELLRPAWESIIASAQKFKEQGGLPRMLE